MAGRLRALDALRAIAVLLVLGRHMPSPPADLAWRAPFVEWMRFGWIGVDLFFVLSGFLVSGLLFVEFQRRAAVRPGRFLVRRGFKIYPPFYLLLVVSVLIEAPPTSKLLAEVFFVQNYATGIWNHTWSLAVEEHFYLLLAIGLALWSRLKRPRPALLVALLVVGMIATVGLRFFLLARNANAFPIYQTHARLDSLGFGVLLSIVYHFHRESLTNWAHRWRWLLLLGAVALLLPALLLGYRDPWMIVWGLTANYLGFGALLLVCLLSGWNLPRGLSGVTERVARVGESSYSIYLWHVPILHWVIEPLKETAYLTRLAIYFPLCIVVGVAFGRLIEQPFLRLRDRLTTA